MYGLHSKKMIQQTQQPSKNQATAPSPYESGNATIYYRIQKMTNDGQLICFKTGEAFNLVVTPLPVIKTEFVNILHSDFWVAPNQDIELLKLYDEVDGYGKGHVAECILIIAKYELSDVQVVDKEINAMAMLIELLGVIK